jgi:hypothetical protein
VPKARFLKQNPAYKHGEYTRVKGPTVERRAYSNAMTRCNNPKYEHYDRYGGRGIEFRFTNYGDFINCVGRRPTLRHSLDRINNDGHYECGNLRWSTWEVQRSNK